VQDRIRGYVLHYSDKPRTRPPGKKAKELIALVGLILPKIWEDLQSPVTLRGLTATYQITEKAEILALKWIFHTLCVEDTAFDETRGYRMRGFWTLRG
jgi:hypothetical protein